MKNNVSLKIKNSPNYYDIIIVGAGTAGCALALHLNNLMKEKQKELKKGFRILIIDKEIKIKKRIVGELMQPKGMQLLKEMKLIECVTSSHVDAIPSIGYEIHMPEKEGRKNSKIKLIYPEKCPQNFYERFGCMKIKNFDFYSSDTNFFSEENIVNIREKISKYCDETNNNYRDDSSLVYAFGFHNALFVNEMREKIKKEENITFVEGNVTAFVGSNNMFCDTQKKLFHNANEKTINIIEKQKTSSNNNIIIGIEYAEVNGEVNDNTRKDREKKYAYSNLTCLCDGGSSLNLRKTYNNSIKQKKLSTWIGILIQHEPFDSPVDTPGVAHVILCSPSPVLIYQISSVHTRCLVCVDVEIQNNNYYDYLHNVVFPQLPSEKMRNKFLSAINERNFMIKNAYSLNAKESLCMGLIAVGDAFNMRHALTGCGMTVTLNDIRILSELIVNENLLDPSASYRISANLCIKRRELAGTLNTLANALHAIFTNPEGKEERKYLQLACYDYLASGGVRSVGPIGLLSGLTQSSLILCLHFFLVVFVAMKNCFLLETKYCSFREFFTQFYLFYSILREGVNILFSFAVNEKITLLASWPIRCLLNIFFHLKET